MGINGFFFDNVKILMRLVTVRPRSDMIECEYSWFFIFHKYWYWGYNDKLFFVATEVSLAQIGLNNRSDQLLKKPATNSFYRPRRKFFKNI